MSDGSGGAPQLDERALKAALAAFRVALDRNEVRTDALSKAIRAYLAASPGAGELDLTDEETRKLIAAIEGVYGQWIEAYALKGMVAKLRARLDRKDDDG